MTMPTERPHVQTTPGTSPPPLLHAPETPGAVFTGGQPPLATVGIRVCAYLLDSLLMVFTLGIGWLIWGAITASDGQTPGKKIMKIAVWDEATNRPMTWGKMVFLRGVVFAGIVMPFIYLFTLGIISFMPLWDRKNQTLVDKMSSSVVVATG